MEKMVTTKLDAFYLYEICFFADMVTHSNNPTIFSMSSQNNNKQILGIQNDTRQGKKKGKFEYFGKK